MSELRFDESTRWEPALFRETFNALSEKFVSERFFKCSSLSFKAGDSKVGLLSAELGVKVQ